MRNKVNYSASLNSNTHEPIQKKRTIDPASAREVKQDISLSDEPTDRKSKKNKKSKKAKK